MKIGTGSDVLKLDHHTHLSELLTETFVQVKNNLAFQLHYLPFLSEEPQVISLRCSCYEPNARFAFPFLHS